MTIGTTLIMRVAPIILSNHVRTNSSADDITLQGQN